ncbi:MAG TPA: glutamate synthase subunit alpha, partial [Terrimesophilobacter sp.]|nr:glutamate synthase subunit alpha [Terrimesophilobacter sp.]
NTHEQDHRLDEHFDVDLIARAHEALEAREPAVIDVTIRNTDRAVGTLLGHEVTRRFGEHGLPPGLIDVTLRGTAGQSLGAFLPGGITLRLVGDANDYVAKGLSGGTVIVRPDPRSKAVAERNIVAGNVIGYGATSGSLFIRGTVGERFMVRNSGAEAVVEGVGDHALEYMTGGTVAILGPTGRNLGAGMSGGTAFVRALRPDRLNQYALEHGELTLLTLDSGDKQNLRRMLEAHLEATESSVAAHLLQSFDSVIDEFVKVLPRDFAAVMQVRTEAELEGLDTDSDAFWEQIVEVTGG